MRAVRRTLQTESAGRVVCWADTSGVGVPLVLVHGLGLAASAYELRPLFERYRGHRPVFALDLPGFGHSERSARPYRISDFVQAIEALLDDCALALPADIVALSLGCEFAALASLSRRERVGSLTLISPTGLSRQPSGAIAAIERAWRSPLLTEPLFELLRSHPLLHRELSRSFVGPVDPGLLEYSWRSAGEPNARFAPMSSRSGALFTSDCCQRLYRRLVHPTLIVFDRDPHTRFDRLRELTADNPLVEAHLLRPSLGMPQFERLDELAAILDQHFRPHSERSGTLRSASA